MTICWFGIYNPDFGRNKIYIQALKKAGHKIIECRDNSPGPVKLFRLWKKHREIKNNYDVIIIGYPGHVIVPLAKFISTKPIIADLLGSLYDAEINSHRSGFWKKFKAKLSDWLAIKFADKILLESKAQKTFFASLFGPNDKYEVVYTGVDESIFNQKSSKSERDRKEFVVLFRGKLTPESGVLRVLQSAEILRAHKDIKFIIIGSGYLNDQVKNFITKNQLSNVEWIRKYLSDEELVLGMSRADISLGQFADNPRLSRTIPHKVFESMVMGLPYITGASVTTAEILKDGESCLVVKLADPEALARAILALKRDDDLKINLAKRAKEIFQQKFASSILAERILIIVNDTQPTLGQVKKIAKFIIAGGAAAFVDLLFLFFLTSVFQIWYIISAILAFLIAFGVSFALQKFWTFQDWSIDFNTVRRQAAIYLMVAILEVFLNTGLVYFLVQYGKTHYLLAQVISGGFIAVLNFFAYQKFIFHGRNL